MKVKTTLSLGFFSFFFSLAAEANTLTTTSKLNLRSENGTLLCTLPSGAKVKALAMVDDGNRVKVKGSSRGCSREGFVSRDFLKGSFSGLKTINAKAPVNCATCGTSGRAQDNNTKNISNIERTISGSRQAKINRLAEAARKEAQKCRRTATHVRRRTGKRTLCGTSVSKGMCYAAVKDALVAGGVLRSRNQLPGGSAHHAHTRGQLRAVGMKNVIGQFNATSAPAGAILVYTGGSHGHGHIEIKTTKSQYCSDYCSARPISNRKLVGVYVFP